MVVVVVVVVVVGGGGGGGGGGVEVGVGVGAGVVVVVVVVFPEAFVARCGFCTPGIVMSLYTTLARLGFGTGTCCRGQADVPGMQVELSCLYVVGPLFVISILHSIQSLCMVKRTNSAFLTIQLF